MLLIFFGDPDTTVFDAEHQTLPLALQKDIDRTVFSIVFDRIADEVAEQLLQVLLRHVDTAVFRLHIEEHMVFSSHRIQRFANFFHAAPQWDIHLLLDDIIAFQA